ncbi:MAG: DUF192 domain-containing protein [Burkholderiales bacterium]|jgi:hypothetical protein|nr:DUF192 domain-containing protein [Burkholderiales bacterium]
MNKELTAAVLLALPTVVYAQLPQIQLNAGIHVIRAEVANTPESRMKGLMFRKTLGTSDGMLFVFDEPQRQCMWMRNTYVPLSVAFIDANGAILNVEDMEPLTESSHCAAGAAKYALEMNKGWFASRGLKAGTRIGGIEKAASAR